MNREWGREEEKSNTCSQKREYMAIDVEFV